MIQATEPFLIPVSTPSREWLAAPAEITNEEWLALRKDVSRILTVLDETKNAIVPAMESIKSGGIMSLITGRK